MFSAIKKAFLPAPQIEDAYALYAEIVKTSRNPFLYKECGIPDTLDGRYESIILHIHLARKSSPSKINQHVIEAFIEDMDRNLREMGVSDTGVGKRVKKMAAGLFGRLKAYSSANTKEELRDVLLRNTYSTLEKPPEQTQIEALIDYILSAY